MIGTILHDRWRILAELGRGGMGEVFLAEHVALGRQEAVKILVPALAGDAQFVTRFRREARAVNRLRHPNIISIYDFGRLADGRFYLSMEYAPGEPVRRLLRKGEGIPVPRALDLLGQLAYAVHHAHSRGVLHRDLKPGNLIVGPGDQLKVLDFGMAKIVAPDLAESAPVSTGNVIWGTPKYMAPERIMGVGTDPRSDLYAIGCLAFELVLGAPPFSGSADEIIHAQLSQVPSAPGALRPSLGIPPELDGVIQRCLAKRPEHRFQSAAELYAALRKVPGYPAPKAEPRRRFVPVEKHPASLESNRAPTDPDAYGNVRGALREAAEALLDLGLSDPRLVTGVAFLRDHEQSLARLEAAQDALEHEAEAVRHTIADRESTLRFARGELQLASGSAPLPELDETMRELDARLDAAAAETDRLRALEQGIASVAGLRKIGLDRVKAAYDALEQVVDELLPAHAGHPALAPLVERLALVKRLRPGAGHGG